MSESIRVRTESKYRYLYNDLKNFVVGDSHELFFICTCIGYKYKKRIVLSGSRVDQDRFFADTITPKEWACYKAIILKENNYELKFIQDDREVIKTIEEYANGGMTILIENFLKDFIITENNIIHFDNSLRKEFSRHFLYFIFTQIDCKIGKIE